MRHALSAEILKLRTTRTSFALIGSALGLVVLLVGVASATASWDAGDSPGLDLLGIAGLTQLFALVLGILAVGSELRHGTITPSLLVTPGRLRLLGAKLIVHVAAGVALGVLAVAVALALMSGIFSLRGISSGLGGDAVVDQGAGIALSIALYAALGVAIGAIVRNQVGAIVGSFAYIFVIESLLLIIPGVDDVISKYGIGGVTDGLAPSEFGPGDSLAQLPAGLLFAAYVAVLLVVGAILLRRRDVSG